MSILRTAKVVTVLQIKKSCCLAYDISGISQTGRSLYRCSSSEGRPCRDTERIHGLSRYRARASIPILFMEEACYLLPAQLIRARGGISIQVREVYIVVQNLDNIHKVLVACSDGL